ncbi:MAG: Serine/threonine-protein kinase PknB [Candidatus Solibacter sp.]|jgi:Flp pilus assembly protein TadD/predicted Ser/Thr protein kinase|nr:Serine/threonine-protein kinase PknB [Candidatus Solibacter sp.]
MICPQCRTPNPDGTKLCVKCATPVDLDNVTLPLFSTPQPEDTTGMETKATAWSSPASTGMYEAAPASGLRPGSMLGERYEIIKLLGEGGMGAVYRAHDRELDRVVALKVIRPELARNAQVLQRFKQELILARQITHRNIIRIFDLGSADGTRFITMEFIEGEDLSAILAKRRKLPADEAAPIMAQVIRGLEAAHAEGVVHRDLKPQNIMIDSDGKASVMDFGIARSMDTTNMTRTGALLGTPTYMSPEQAQGHKVDSRSDLYTLGIIFYELLTGNPPFEADHPMATLVRRIQEKPVPPIQIEPTIPKAINDMVLKMLGTKPEERYQTAVEILADLDAFEVHRTGRTMLGVVAAPPVKKIGYLPFIAAGMVVGVIMGASLLYMRKGGVPAAPAVTKTVRLLVSDFQNATKDPVFDGTLEPTFALALGDAAFINSYSRGDARTVARQLQPGATQLDEKLAQLVAAREGIDVVVSGAIEPAGSGYTIRARALDTATSKVLVEKSANAKGKQDVLAAAGKLAAPIRKALGDTTPESAQLRAAETYSSSSLEAAQAYAKGQELQWDAKFRDAIRPFEQAIVFDPEMGRAYAGLAVMHRNLGDRNEAEKNFQLAIARTARMTDREQYRTRGAYYLFMRNDQKALDEFSTLTKQFPADDAGRINLATALLYTHNFPRAIEEGRQAVKLNPKKPLYRNNVALYEMYSGRFDDAIRDAGEAMKLNPAYTRAYLATALSQFASGKIVDAAATYQKLAGIGAQGASLSTIGLADMAIYEGRDAEAAAILETAIAADRAADPKSAGDGNKLAALATALRANKAQALEAANRALAVSKTEAFSYAAARVLLEFGQDAKALEVAKAMGARLEPEPRAYAKLIEGEALLNKGKAQAAIDLFQEAQKLADTWIGRLVLGRAYLEANAFTEASSEFGSCEKRKGEAASVFLDDIPSLRYYPQVYYYRARTEEGMKSPAAGESYKTFLAIKAKASPTDPMVADARKRAKALGVPGL